MTEMRTGKKKTTLDGNINKRMKNNSTRNNNNQIEDMDVAKESKNSSGSNRGTDDTTMDNESYDFKFSQCFGDKTDIVVTEADVITSVEFDHTGEYLATGDKGGRVVLFQRNHNANISSSTITTASKKQDNHCEYRFFTEFQSHDAEFDYLKSLEIEEKINQIKWLKPIQKSHFLLSTNDKTIKLWKIYEKNINLVSQNNNNNNNNNNNLLPINFSDRHARSVTLSLENLRLPQLSKQDTIIASTPKKIYSNAHTYHINSISTNSDQETFLSADDLRINLWNLNIPNQSFNIVDIKPANMEELTEVITCAEFHPINCNYFMYSSSKGTVKLCDMRINSLCDNFSSSSTNTKTFEEYINPINHNFFTEITSSISDIKFSPNGRYIVSRDYLTVKIWDINMENKPLKTINVNDQLKERLSDTYENDAIFDKFEVSFNGKSNSIITGTYNNQFMIYPNVLNPLSNEKNNNTDEIILQADKTAFRNKSSYNNNNNNNVIKEWGDDIDFKKSILHFSWHPRENSIAVAATNNLFIFSAL